MLRILEFNPPFSTPIMEKVTISELLYHSESRPFSFKIKAPLYWWVDCSYPTHFLNMPLDDFEFCFESFPKDSDVYKTIVKEVASRNYSPRQLMQILPLGTYATGTILLTAYGRCPWASYCMWDRARRKS